MVYSFAEKAKKDGGDEEIHVIELEQSIRRNFSGLDDIDPVKIFSGQFPRLKRYAKVIKYKAIHTYCVLSVSSQSVLLKCLENSIKVRTITYFQKISQEVS